MNRVGEAGKGESVWLGWFLYATLVGVRAAGGYARRHARARPWRIMRKRCKLRSSGTAGTANWYRRGYFDDGTPLGSAANNECRIDSIAQSWSVISGAADPGRAARAMAAVDRYLVRRETGLVLLFTPPFDHTPPRPGLYQGLSARHPRERRPIYPCRDLVGDRVRNAGRGRQGVRSCSRSSTRSIIPARARSVHRYKVEPYVVAADVYSAPPHVGRGGWTWYTGSAGWMYRAGIESILGLRRQGAFLLLAPCIPKDWPGFEIVFRYGSARYEIVVENPHGVSRGIATAQLDGQPLSEIPIRVPLCDDGTVHKLRAVLG